MRRDLVEQLVCPVTRDPLKLEVTREDEHGDVIEGALISERINFRYPIEDGIPTCSRPTCSAAPANLPDRPRSTTTRWTVWVVFGAIVRQIPPM